MYYNWFNQSPTDILASCFQNLAIVNNATIYSPVNRLFHNAWLSREKKFLVVKLLQNDLQRLYQFILPSLYRWKVPIYCGTSKISGSQSSNSGDSDLVGGAWNWGGERGACVLVLNSKDTLICSQGQKAWAENRSLLFGLFHFSLTGTKSHKMNS